MQPFCFRYGMSCFQTDMSGDGHEAFGQVVVVRAIAHLRRGPGPTVDQLGKLLARGAIGLADRMIAAVADRREPGAEVPARPPTAGWGACV